MLVQQVGTTCWPNLLFQYIGPTFHPLFPTQKIIFNLRETDHGMEDIYLAIARQRNCFPHEVDTMTKRLCAVDFNQTVINLLNLSLYKTSRSTWSSASFFFFFFLSVGAVCFKRTHLPRCWGRRPFKKETRRFLREKC